MAIVIASQTPAPGATDHPAADFYEIVFESTLGINPLWALVRVTFDAVLVFDWSFIGGLVMAPGWEGAATVGPGGLTFTAQFRPVGGGWNEGANYGAGGGALVGRIEAVTVASEDTPFAGGPPDFDFSTAAASEIVADHPVGGAPTQPAAAWVVASGAMTSHQRVAQVVREGPGVYRLDFPSGLGRPLSEYVPQITVLAAFMRTATISEVDAGGASLRVRTWNGAGEPADANFSFWMRRR